MPADLMFSAERAQWAARSMIDAIAVTFPSEVSDCRLMQLVSQDLLDVIAEARVDFIEDYPDHGELFDRLAAELLDQPYVVTNVPEPVPPPITSREVLDEVGEHLKEKLTFVDAVVDASRLACEARLKHRDLSARLRVMLDKSGELVENVHLVADCAPGPRVRLTPERGMFKFIRRLGETKVGDAALDDAYIIDGEAGAVDMLRSARALLLRLARSKDVAIQFGSEELRASLRLRSHNFRKAEPAVKLVELWCATSDYRAGLKS